MQAANDLRRAPPHRVDCRPAVLRSCERRRVRACGRRYLLAGDVRLDLRLEHAGVDEHDVHALLAQPVAQIRIFLPLCVEGAEEDDGRHAAPILLLGGCGFQAGAESFGPSVSLVSSRCRG